jgi:hypothetical protein
MLQLRRAVCLVGCAAIAAALMAAPGALAAAPPNDAFANAQALAADNSTVSGTNSGATVEPGEPWHAGSAAAHSVWYRLTTTGPAQISLNTCDADFNTVLGVYTGDSVAFLTPVASSDDSPTCGGGPGSSVSFHYIVPATFAIAVDGHGGDQGGFRLHVDFTPDPGYAVIDALKVNHRKGTATAFFSGSNPGMHFTCTLDRARSRQCTSPFTFGRHKTWGRLKKGIHSLAVMAFDSAGRSVSHPTARAFRIK